MDQVGAKLFQSTCPTTGGCAGVRERIIVLPDEDQAQRCLSLWALTHILVPGELIVVFVPPQNVTPLTEAVDGW